MTTIKLKNGSGAPTAGDLAQGEPALDLTNKRLYTEDSGGTVIEVGTNPTSVTTGDITATGTATFAGLTTTADVSFGDNDKAIFGAGSDLQIYHDGSNSYVQDTGDGDLILQGTNVQLRSNNTMRVLQGVQGAETKIFYNNAQKLATTSTGIDVTGTVTADGLTVDGDGSFTGDFEISGLSPKIFLNETDTTDVNTRIRNSGGNLQIQTVTDSDSSPVTRFDIDHATGDISFYEDTGTTAKLFWDASAESLGIGTSSPAAKIEAVGATALRLRNGATDGFTFAQANTNSWTFTGLSAGSNLGFQNTNVGIGTSSPSSPLEVAGGSSYPTTKFSRDGGSAATQGYLTTGFSAIGYSGGTGADSYLVSEHGFGFAVNAGTNALVITDGGNVGIGTSSPSNLVHLQSSLDTLLKIESTDTVVRLDLTDSGGTSLIQNTSGKLVLQADNANAVANSYLGFEVDGSEAMRIDSSGNLLVGTTTTTAGNEGMVYFNGSSLRVTRDSDEPLNLDRLTTDGTIAAFKKDGTTVGSIGVTSASTDIYIGSGDCGVRFDDTNQAIKPWDTSTNAAETANPIDLGASGARFKDLYLSGGAYLGGTDSANLLDDYEEGTYTVTLRDATSGGNASSSTVVGTYTKVGRLVTCSFNTALNNIDTTGMTGTNALYMDLPFATNASCEDVGTLVYDSLDTGSINASITNVVPDGVGGAVAVCQFRAYGDSTNDTFLQVQDITSGTTDFVRFTYTYQTA